ncbi:alpha/beta hydrolase family protein [Micromonospora polyrhachis]|uniref:Pimeloyl-ACP methyl ester carboxylesterase n=1 Tax=Micromonospora polyrhachis TaxID=1282883 RepID=A0A7W7WRJ0_9ACTN|nr:alpha/beta fold hydrolase [Micromonospora polyrhachis]MBB4960979.1 pimeloyl-ACP methyl ester carboxylesterase [Micromonospora polyrhachis]
MASRIRTDRWRRFLYSAFVAVSVTVPMVGAARPGAVPTPAPLALAPLRAGVCADIVGRYAINLDGIRATEQMATDHGDRSRAAVLRTMADPTRQFLSFDGRDGGRTVEVFGDLCRAERIAVLVPGADTNLDSYQRLPADAEALHRELGDRIAVVAWLGYRTPATISPQVLTPGRAADGAAELRTFIRELGVAAPDARVALVCHSYGTVVCAQAAPGLQVADIVLYGSPGTGVDDVAGLRTSATVWAGRSTGDWIDNVPHLRLRLPFATIGLGADPVSPPFGARIFAAGDGGHSDYLKPGSVSLRSIAQIVAGEGPAEERGHA